MMARQTGRRRKILAVWSAGISVLLKGRFTDRDTCNANVALPPGIRRLPFGLDSRIGRIARAGPDGIAVMGDTAQSGRRRRGGHPLQQAVQSGTVR
jgi:hypothetical protein